MVEINARFLCLLLPYLLWATSASAFAPDAADNQQLKGRSPLPDPFRPFRGFPDLKSTPEERANVDVDVNARDADSADSANKLNANLNGRSPSPEPFRPFRGFPDLKSTPERSEANAGYEGDAKAKVKARAKVDARDGKGVVIPLRKRVWPPAIRTGPGSTDVKERAELPPPDLNALRGLREKLQDKYSDRYEDGGRRMRARRSMHQDQDKANDKRAKEKREKEKRAAQTIPMTNNNGDVTYTATILLGTPAKPFEVILDTGSSDTWVTSTSCADCSGGNSWDPSTSSSWQARARILNISYGSGRVAGRTGSDVLTMGGFTINDQVIGLVDQAEAILPGEVEGLMGLAFGRIAKSGGTPWWLRLAGGDAANSGGTLDSPLFSFWFSRHVDPSSSADVAEAPGGQFTIGGTNSSLYTGDINWYPAARPAQWWVIAMAGMTVNGNGVALDATNNRAIIDTGTTLIGGEEETLDAIFSTIPNARKGDDLSDSLAGYYLLPCASTATISLVFGEDSYTISAQDVLFLEIDQFMTGYCVTSFFVFASSRPSSPDYVPAGQPYWLVGDAFLKNVYSVYSLGDGGSGEAGVNGMGNLGETSQVGFAKLSTTDGQIGLASGSSPGSGTGLQDSGGSGTTGIPMGNIPTGIGGDGDGDASTTVVIVAPTDGASGAGFTNVQVMRTGLVVAVVAGVTAVLAGSL